MHTVLTVSDHCEHVRHRIFQRLQVKVIRPFRGEPLSVHLIRVISVSALHIEIVSAPFDWHINPYVGRVSITLNYELELSLLNWKSGKTSHREKQTLREIC